MLIGIRSLTLAVLAVAALGCSSTASDSTESRESVSCPAQAPAWASGTTYATGAIVTYNGTTYRCRQGHTALDNWTPDVVLALWEPVQCTGGGGGAGGGGAGGGGAGGGGGGGSTVQRDARGRPARPTHVGDVVIYAANGNDYVATHDNPGYDPTISTWFWSPTTCTGGSGGGGGGGGGGAGGGGGGTAAAAAAAAAPATATAPSSSAPTRTPAST